MRNYKDLILNSDGQPLRILQVGRHTCIRVIRIAEALKSVGYTVDLLSNRVAYGTDIFDRMGYWHNELQFKNHLRAFRDKYDIIECHNEPDDMVKWTREVLGRKPTKTKIIHNAHDLDNVRRGIIPIPERMAFIGSDAIVYVSEPIMERCNELHQISYPTMVIYNYPTQSMVDNTKIEWDKVHERKSTLVYEGGVNPIGNTPDIHEMNRVFKYRDLFPIFQQLIAQGNEVHVYPGNSSAFHSGQTTGVMLHSPTKFDVLLQEMVQFKYNLLTFNNEDKKQDQVNFTTPNKLWDGLCAGLPSIACWCDETEKYVKKHDIGWVFPNIQAIGDCSSIDPDYMNKIENVRNKRKELIFERQVWRVENFYAEVLGVEKKSIPDDIKKQSVFEYGKKDTEKLLRGDF